MYGLDLAPDSLGQDLLQFMSCRFADCHNCFVESLGFRISQPLA